MAHSGHTKQQTFFPWYVLLATISRIEQFKQRCSLDFEDILIPIILIYVDVRFIKPPNYRYAFLVLNYA